MKPRLATLQALVAAAFLFTVSSLAAPAAKAELKPKFDKLQLYSTISTTPTIEVKAEGKNWTDVINSSLTVKTNYYVSLSKGKLMTISAIYELYPIAKVRHTDGKWRKGTFTFEISKGQLGTVVHRAINACNELKKNGARTDETHTTHIPLPFYLSVRAERVGNQATKRADGNIQAKVVCKKAPKVLEITHLNVKWDKSTGKCPIKGVVEVGFNTNRADEIKFTLGHMNRGLRTTEHTAKPFMISGQYVATKRIDLTIDSNTEYVQVELKNGDGWKRWVAVADTKVKCPPFEIFSVWMTVKVLHKGFCPGKYERIITVNANGPGTFQYETLADKPGVSGVGATNTGLTKLEGDKYVFTSKSTYTYNKTMDHQMMANIINSPHNSGWVPVKALCPQPLKTTLAFLDFQSPKCPRGVQAVAQIEADYEGPMAYQLDCASNENSWSFKGIAEVKKSGNKFIAGLGHRLDIDETQHVNCALKRMGLNTFKIIALKGHKMQCVKKNPDIPEGPSDLQVDKPQHHSKPPVQDFGVKQPKCKWQWKTKCTNKPVKTCKPLIKQDCKKVPKTVCKNKQTRSCTKVPKRECKIVRGEPVCRTVMKNKCKTVTKRVCEKKTETVCKRKITNKCTTVNKKTCKRVRKKVCPLKLKKRR